MRIAPTRSLLWRGLTVVLTLATVRLVATDLAALHRRADTLGPPREAVEVRRDLPLGTVLTTGDLRTVERPASLLVDGQVADVDDAVGRTVVVPLVAGAPLLRDHHAPSDRAGTSALVRPGHVAVRVATRDGLQPPPGARVAVLAVTDAGSVGAPPGARVVARVARVLARDDHGDTDPGVVLEVSMDEATDVAFAATNGAIALAQLAPEDACCDDDSP